MQRRLAAILAADVVGYSRLVGADEAGTLAALKTLRSNYIEPLVAAHRGRVVKVMGDGFLVEFASAVDAVSAAIAWQLGLTGDGTSGVSFRIGVNIGDVVSEDGDIYGDGVIIATRLEGAADPGGVCIADMVHQSVTGKVETGFFDLGEIALKNIDRPIRAWAWRSDAGMPHATQGDTGSAVVPVDGPSIAVLPFDDMSNDPDQAFFCDGITEDLITELARIPGLTVIARHSSFAYKSRSVDVRRIGAELGVGHLVEGSVRRAGNRVRITAQLIEAANGSHLWAQRYDRAVDDVFAVQDDVVRHIADALAKAMERPELLEHQPAPRPANREAYELVMRGRQNILRAQARHEVRPDLERAIALDPTLLDAHAWLAVYYYTDWFNYHREPRHESLVAAFAAADTAIALGPESSLAHMALGMVSLYAGRRAVALETLHRALELNPNEADAYCLMQDAYTFDGQAKRGVESVQTAMRLNPHYPEWYVWHLGFALYCMRDYEGALRELDKVEITEPLRIRAAAHARLGHIEAAQADATRFLAVFPDFSASAWGRTQPFRNAEDLEHVLEGYRLAGLPA